MAIVYLQVEVHLSIQKIGCLAGGSLKIGGAGGGGIAGGGIGIVCGGVGGDETTVCICGRAVRGTVIVGFICTVVV